MSGTANLAMGGSAAFVVLLTALHALRPDVDPSWTVISAYALGGYGSLMTAAFASMAIACVALGLHLRPHVRSRVGRLGLALLAVCAIGFALAAVFPTDPITAPPDESTRAGRLHSAGAMLGGLLPFAALALTWDLARRPEWSVARPWLWSATAAAWLGDIVFVAAMATMLPRGGGSLGPAVQIGWPNRFMILTYCAWVFVSARQSSRVAVNAAPASDTPPPFAPRR